MHWRNLCLNVMSLLLYVTELNLILHLGEKEGKLFSKKNLAKERMQRIRSLNIDKEKFKEMCCADLISEKASWKSSANLPDSSGMRIKFYVLHLFIFYTFDEVLRYLLTFFNIFTLFFIYRQQRCRIDVYL